MRFKVLVWASLASATCGFPGWAPYRSDQTCSHALACFWDTTGFPVSAATSIPWPYQQTYTIIYIKEKNRPFVFHVADGRKCTWRSCRLVNNSTWK